MSNLSNLSNFLQRFIATHHHNTVLCDPSSTRLQSFSSTLSAKHFSATSHRNSSATLLTTICLQHVSSPCFFNAPLTPFYFCNTSSTLLYPPFSETSLRHPSPIPLKPPPLHFPTTLSTTCLPITPLKTLLQHSPATLLFDTFLQHFFCNTPLQHSSVQHFFAFGKSYKKRRDL